ncbi:hypothetical protein ACFFQW_11010 [Umezawaea endophytica]|uniref:ATP-grasp domain-containing protein n=1 Tax=Umezawaea endophytica TaxID=1654476 RepID=A0A9X3AKY3_9PSEU|nr:hypothetical protein [Umezawaea endophytica]MCS7483585.1 hypothetical protein [Umezawaea endophytica]
MTTGRVVRFGTFDVERRWRPDGLATLPAITDPAADLVTSAMDELLAVTCGPGDVLFTGADVPPSFQAVLQDAGVDVDHRVAPPDPAAPGATVERRLLSRPPEDLRGTASTPYAVLPETSEVVRALGLRAAVPECRAVRTVSSKSWSNELVRELGLFGAGVVVDSVPRLLEEVEALDGETVLLKDPFGVSGRGTIEVSSPGVLRSVSRVLSRQADRGLAVEVLVQRRFDRVADFSAQFHVRADGRVDWYGVRLIENTGFTYAGSRPVPAELGTRLAELGYRAVLEEVGAALAGAGYHGPVCVDSMLLRDGTLVPVLEINPRMSMGLISILAARRLAGPATRARLAVRTLPTDSPHRTFDALVEDLSASRALFRSGGTGLLPLAANTLLSSRGRLYCAVVARDQDEDRMLDTVLDEVVASLAARRVAVGHAS